MKQPKSRKNKKPQPFQDSRFSFDDCPVCQTMKEAEDKGKNLSYSKLIEAFVKAKEKGNVVSMPYPPN